MAIVDVDSKTAAETAGWLRETTGSDTMAFQCDVTSPEQVDDMVAAVTDRYKKLDAAFCNAGICINEAAELMSFEHWKKVIDINLTGVFLTARAAGRVMLEQGHGSIINTASMSAHIVNVPQPQCAYNASKAGVIHGQTGQAGRAAVRLRLSGRRHKHLYHRFRLCGRRRIHQFLRGRPQ